MVSAVARRTQFCVGVAMDFLIDGSLIDGQISSFCPDQSEAEGKKPINATKTHSIFVKH